MPPVHRYRCCEGHTASRNVQNNVHMFPIALYQVVLDHSVLTWVRSAKGRLYTVYVRGGNSNRRREYKQLNSTRISTLSTYSSNAFARLNVRGTGVRDSLRTVDMVGLVSLAKVDVGKVHAACNRAVRECLRREHMATRSPGDRLKCSLARCGRAAKKLCFGPAWKHSEGFLQTGKKASKRNRSEDALFFHVPSFRMPVAPGGTLSYVPFRI
jgi:hypothetical protein